jgi:hypothetical protein
MKRNAIPRRSARLLARREMIPALIVFAPLWLLAPLAVIIPVQGEEVDKHR